MGLSFWQKSSLASQFGRSFPDGCARSASLRRFWDQCRFRIWFSSFSRCGTMEARQWFLLFSGRKILRDYLAGLLRDSFGPTKTDLEISGKFRRGAPQKEVGTKSSITFFFFFIFGHFLATFFWRFCHLFRPFSARLLLPNSLCDRVIFRKKTRNSKRKPRVCKPWFPNRGSRLPAEQRLNWGKN